MKKEIKITLGADPEFDILDPIDMCVVEAYNYITDPERVAPIGLDGCSSTGELRPRPGSWGQLYLSLSYLIRKADEQNIVMSVKGDTFALGGHIHFGGIEESMILPIVRAMDSFVLPLLQPLEGRARGCYARRGNYETKSYGFEYRSLPAGWLACPELAKLTLKLSYKVAKSVICYGLDASGDPVAPTYESYKHLLNKRDYNRLIELVTKLRTDRYLAINPAWGGKKINLIKKVTFRDDFEREVRDFSYIPEKGLPIDIIIFGLNGNRGNNLIYCPQLQELADVIGATHVDSSFRYRRTERDTLHIGLSPDLRNIETIKKIINYVCDHCE
jgi:hypothetical protein